MKHQRELLKNSLWKGLSQILLIVVNLLSIPAITHYLGIEKFGLLMIVKLFSTDGLLSFFELGMQSSLARNLPKDLSDGNHEQVRKIFWSFLWTAFLVGLLCAAGVMLIGGLVIHQMSLTESQMQELTSLLPFVSLGLLFGYGQFVIFGLMDGTRQFGFQSVMEFGNSALTAIFFLILAFQKAPLSWFVLADVLAAFLLFCFSLYGMVKRYPWLIPSFSQIPGFNRKLLSAYFEDLKMFSSVRLSSVLFHQSDRLVIGSLMGPLFVGQFELIVKLPKVIKMASSALGATLIPMVSE
ncbi:MAG: oligosaccharide flippase family protein, partial [Pseudobdellovibrionaceae bacterium]